MTPYPQSVALAAAPEGRTRGAMAQGARRGKGLPLGWCRDVISGEPWNRCPQTRLLTVTLGPYQAVQGMARGAERLAQGSSVPGLVVQGSHGTFPAGGAPAITGHHPPTPPPALSSSPYSHVTHAIHTPSPLLPTGPLPVWSCAYTPGHIHRHTWPQGRPGPAHSSCTPSHASPSSFLTCPHGFSKLLDILQPRVGSPPLPQALVYLLPEVTSVLLGRELSGDPRVT